MKSKSKIKNIHSKQLKRYVLILCTIFTIVVTASPQMNFHKAEDSVITVAGTSTFKSWAMTATQMSSDAKFEFDKAGNPKHLNSLTFKLHAKSLLSGSSGLDKNAYSALKTDKHPDISYRSVSSTISRIADGSYKISVRGSLTIAGVTKVKNIEAICVSMSNGSQSCSGETKLLMTDFGVKPPVFMMGAMKTGNEITINYKMNYKP